MELAVTVKFGEAVRTLARPIETEDEDGSRVVQGAQALTRGLSLLELVGAAARPLRFSEIVDGSGLAKGTAHRMLSALVEAGFLGLDAATQTYRLGNRLFELAHRVWSDFDLRGAAEPELERLRDLTGEATRLAIIDGRDILYIDQREAMQAVRLANGVGGRTSLSATSAGKAILAQLDPPTRHRLLSSLELKAWTPRSITDAELLDRELDLIKARGYAISIEEQTLGVNSVAATILDHRARPLGALCVLGPAYRMPSERLHALGRDVIEAARRCSGNAGQSFMSITIGEKPRRPARPDVRVAAPAAAFLGEGPVWSAEARRLYWVDILAPALHASDPETGETTVQRMPELIGCVALRARGGFVAGMQGGFKTVDPGSGAITLIADPEADRPGNRFNDGKCDRRGRFWAGTLALDAARDVGSLYRLDPNGRTSLMESGVHVSNGLGWSPDDRTFYFTDSGRRIIYAYEFDLETGTIANRRVFASFAEDVGTPDGLTVDAEGFVWVAHWDGWRVSRHDPDGVVERIIDMPVPRPTSCAFGGPDLRTLFVTSARIRLSAAQLADAPLSGSVFAIETGVRGLPEPAYEG